MANVLSRQYERWLLSVLKVPRSSVVPLLAAYLALFKGRRTEALSKVNRVMGTNYQMKRWREWERGSMALSNKLRYHMQRTVIKARLGGEAGHALLRLLDLEGSNSDLL